MLILKQKGLDAWWPSALRVLGAGSFREQEVHEILGERVSSRGGERVRVIHHHLILGADRDDVTGGHGLEVHLVMGPHHAEGERIEAMWPRGGVNRPAHRI
jgi:hypothetical protein